MIDLNSLLQKPQVRNAMRTLASELLSFLDATEPVVEPEPIAELLQPNPPVEPARKEKDPDAVRPTITLLSTVPPIPERVGELQLGGSTIKVRIQDGTGSHEEIRAIPTGFAGPKVVATEPPPVAYDNSIVDLGLIAQRCRLKAAACKFVDTRRKGLESGVDFRDFAEEHRSFVSSAKTLGGCYLWMTDINRTFTDATDFVLLSGLYDTLANAAELVKELHDTNHASLVQGIYLLAEAQSALRTALLNLLEDTDQHEAYRWVRDAAEAMSVFIDRYMRVDDNADPATWANIMSRVMTIKESVGAQRRTEKERKALLSKIKYHAKRIAGGNPTQDDWSKVTTSVETLITYGLPPSNVELRNLITPIFSLFPPADYGHGMTAVLSEIDRLAEEQALKSEQDVPVEPKQPTPAVAKVANLLRGKKLLLVGGTRSPKSQEALKDAFGLDEMIWPSTRKHESLSVFESDARRADMVLLAIRWSSHSYGDIKTLCDAAGKPFIRLKAGYNPNQVAQAILSQAGDSLGADEVADVPNPFTVAKRARKSHC